MSQIAFKKHIDYDPELEARVLGVFIAEPSAFGSHFNLVNDDCFLAPEHKEVFQALKTVFNEGLPIDLITVSRSFYSREVTEIGGVSVAYFLAQLINGVFSSAHLEGWCVFLRQLAARRLMVELTNSGIGDNDVLENAKLIEQKLRQVLDVRVSDDWKDTSQVAIAFQQRMETTDQVPGIPTPIETVNKLNGGLRAGQMVIIGARPSVGKSAFAGQIATHSAGLGYKTGIVSLEMDNLDVFGRLLSADSLVDHWKIDRNFIAEEWQRKQVMNSLTRLSTLPLYFSDKAQVNVHDIRSKAEKLKRKHGLDLLLIDYLQLVEAEGKNPNREQEISKISRGVKLLAMTLQIPIIMLAQLNREAADKEPELHHLRESGSIEQDADIVMFLHRLKDESGQMGEDVKLLIRKWRNGATADVDLKFHKETMRFYNPNEIDNRPNAGFQNAVSNFKPFG